MITSFSKKFGTVLGIEYKEDSFILTYMNHNLSGITLLSSAKLPIKGDEGESHSISEYAARHGKNLSGIFLTVPDSWSITRFISVPATKGSDALQQLMSFEIERHIPFSLEDVLYDFQVVQEKAKTFDIVFTVLQKQKVNRIVSILENLHLKPQVITTASFAILNFIEQGSTDAGGWKHLAGFARSTGRTGKKGMVSISMYVDRGYAAVAVFQDLVCRGIKSFFSSDGEESALCDDVLEFIGDMKYDHEFEKFDRLLLSGDSALISACRDHMAEQMNVPVTSLDEQDGFVRALTDAGPLRVAPSAGACYTGLGIGGFRINILPHKRDYVAGKTGSRAAVVLLCAILLLLAAIVSAEYVRTKRYIERIDQAMKHNEPEIAALQKITSSIRDLAEQKAVLQGIRDNELSLEVLAELSRILPKDTWLTTLDYKSAVIGGKKQEDGELVIGGLAEASSQLIALLEDSPLFEKVEFMGPIRKALDKEGFKIKATIVKPAAQEEQEP